MGFFDGWDGGSVVSHKSSHKHRKSSSSHKHKRSKSQERDREERKRSAPGIGSIFGVDDHYSKHNASRGSFFNLGNQSNHSSRSFFGFGRSPSYYRRSPRGNFMQRAYKQVKRLLRDLVYYAKRHPMKVFMLVIMPLITGGALTALLARFGLRLPPGLERMLGLAAKTASGDGIGLVGEAVRMAGNLGGNGSVHLERGRQGDFQWERKSMERDGWSSGVGNDIVRGIGKMFL